MSLLFRIERHLRRANQAPTRFGIEAVGDPRLVFDLRRGREPRPGTVKRIEAFIDNSVAASA
jgi:hypothetical protein